MPKFRQDQFGSPQCKGRIPLLVPPGQADVQVLVAAFGGLHIEDEPVQICINTGDFHLLLNVMVRRTLMLGRSTDDRDRIGMACRRQHGYARLDDARFLTCNVRVGRAEQIGMLQPDVRDERGCWADDVCCIQPSSKAHFYDGEIHLLLGEVQKRKGCRRFEKAGSYDFERLAIPFDRTLKPGLRCRRAIDPHTFCEGKQVRRRMQSHAFPACRCDGRQKRGCRSLSVRPRYVHAFELLVRLSHGFHERPHSLQTGPVGDRTLIGKPGEIKEEVGCCAHDRWQTEREDDHGQPARTPVDRKIVPGESITSGGMMKNARYGASSALCKDVPPHPGYVHTTSHVFGAHELDPTRMIAGMCQT